MAHDEVGRAHMGKQLLAREERHGAGHRRQWPTPGLKDEPKLGTRRENVRYQCRKTGERTRRADRGDELHKSGPTQRARGLTEASSSHWTKNASASRAIKRPVSESRVTEDTGST